MIRQWRGGTRLTIRIARGPTRDPESVKRMILDDPGIIEDGFLALDTHLRAGSGGLIDLLGVAPTGGLVFLEIENSGESELLSRIQAHQKWLASELSFLRLLYGGYRVHPFLEPRAMALAPEFSSTFLKKISELTFDVRPVRYRILRAGEELAVLLEPLGESLEWEPLPLAMKDQEEPVRPTVEAVPAPPSRVERLSPEEMDAFYRYEREQGQTASPTERIEP